MTSFVSRLFSSIILRLGLAFGALAAMTTAAIIVAWLVFQSIGSSMVELSDDLLPELRNSANVVSATDNIRNILLDILVAQSTGDLNTLDEARQASLAQIRAHLAGAAPSESSEIVTLVDEVEASLFELIDARKDALASQASVMETVREGLGRATKATGILANASDAVYFDLVLGGDATIETVDAGLSELIEKDFALYQSALASHSEMNLLSGLALSRTQTGDVSVRSILSDLATASSERLTGLLDVLSEDAKTAVLAEELKTAQMVLMKVFGTGFTTMRPTTILSLRQSADAALSLALDDIHFDLVIKSEETKTANKDSIRGLLEVQVNAIRDQAVLDGANRAFVSAMLQVAMSPDPLALDLNGAELALAATQLTRAMEGATDDIRANLSEMLKTADPAKGIVFTRAEALDAEHRALDATEKATAAVSQIAQVVSDAADRARSDIEASAANLDQKVDVAQTRIETISLLSILLVVLAPFFIWLLITRPLNRVTRVTERLAKGDLSEIAGLSQKYGEIGRLAQALQVFRQGALERIKLQADEEGYQKEKREAERAAEQAKREAEQRARDLEEQRAKDDRERESEAKALEEEQRQREDQERRARAAEQELVVSQLAQGLNRLSNGDLSITIDTVFPVDYESLRTDYNSAVLSLSDIIDKIGFCAEAINQSSAEIASASLDLSTRTEKAAATLEETATALNSVTQGVSVAAQGASNAAREANDVNHKTKESRKVMTRAVNAMHEIEGSSSEIGQIVSVIDSIAFQTNLLALNAGVEAARAGEAGAGFAVVASEVRLLAHRSAEAASQIQSLVSSSTSQVENGVTLLAETSSLLDGNLNDISAMAKSMVDIASSSDQQSKGLSEINHSVEVLDGATQKNAAMFEETTAANQSLTEQARQLIKMVSGFTTATTAGDVSVVENQREQLAG